MFLAFPLLLLLTLSSCGRLPRLIVLEDPLTAAEHLELGVAYERAGKPDLAIREYERALRKEKGLFRARLNLGNALLAKKEYGRARKEYLAALATRPGDPEATNNLAWAAILSGEHMEDASARMEAVVSRPGNRTPPLLDTLGVLRMRAGRPDDAAEALAEAERACRESGEPACPEEVLREIRDHRAELKGRFPPSAAPPLVQ